MIQGSLLGFPEFQVIVRSELFDSRVHASLMGSVVVRCKFDALEEGINGGIFERRFVECYFRYSPSVMSAYRTTLGCLFQVKFSVFHV